MTGNGRQLVVTSGLLHRTGSTTINAIRNSIHFNLFCSMSFKALFLLIVDIVTSTWVWYSVFISGWFLSWCSRDDALRVKTWQKLSIPNPQFLQKVDYKTHRYTGRFLYTREQFMCTQYINQLELLLYYPPCAPFDLNTNAHLNYSLVCGISFVISSCWKSWKQ